MTTLDLLRLKPDIAHRKTLLHISLAASIFYLYLPIFIFIVGWLRWPVAIIITLTTVGLLYNFFHSERHDFRRRLTKVPRNLLLLCLLIYIISTIILAALGIGGITGQAADWDKHNMILQTLISEEWPVIVNHQGTDFVLSYYIAYYLPAAIVGKAFGWVAANIFLLLYSSLGLSALIALGCEPNLSG